MPRVPIVRMQEVFRNALPPQDGVGRREKVVHELSEGPLCEAVQIKASLQEVLASSLYVASPGAPEGGWSEWEGGTWPF